jgi:hypothetical protein
MIQFIKNKMEKNIIDNMIKIIKINKIMFKNINQIKL